MRMACSWLWVFWGVGGNSFIVHGHNHMAWHMSWHVFMPSLVLPCHLYIMSIKTSFHAHKGGVPVLDLFLRCSDIFF
jgi:hypothetical protein